MADERMHGFGYKTGWLAIRGGEAEEVVAALGGEMAGTVGWSEGVRASYNAEDTVMVTPPLPGRDGETWTLVAGSYILLHRSLDIARLSADLGTEVQRFGTHRVSEGHCWERAVNGVRVRYFEYEGGKGVSPDSFGEPDQTERAIGLAEDMSPVGVLFVGEEDVMAIAGAWSVDPTSLDGAPAAAPLVLAKFPVAESRPMRRHTVVNVTDIIVSGLDVDEKNRRIAQRVRERKRRDRWHAIAAMFRPHRRD
jgi:hypothetical protein